MTKKLLISICTLVVISVVLIGHVVSAEEKITQSNWQSIIDVKLQGMEVFVNRNETLTQETKDTKLTSVDILLSYKEPIEIAVNGKKIIIRSVVKSMIAECKSGMVVPMYDIYFSVPKPEAGSVPLAGIEYSSDVRANATEIRKGSIMHNIMCPEYI